MSCVEHDFSKVARLEVYPTTSTPFATPLYSNATAPVSISNPTLTKVDFLRDSMKCSDKSSRSVAGILHQVQITWDCQPVSAAQYALLETLQSTPHEVIVTYFGMQRKAIRTSDEGYAFDFQDDNGTMKCTMTLTNGQGLTALL